MSATWHKLKSWIAGITALIACPCHLPLTLPLLIGLAGGRIIKIDSDGLKVREYTRDNEGRALSFKDRALKILTKEEGGIPTR